MNDEEKRKLRQQTMATIAADGGMTLTEAEVSFCALEVTILGNKQGMSMQQRIEELIERAPPTRENILAFDALVGRYETRGKTGEQITLIKGVQSSPHYKLIS